MKLNAPCALRIAAVLPKKIKCVLVGSFWRMYSGPRLLHAPSLFEDGCDAIGTSRLGLSRSLDAVELFR